MKLSELNILPNHQVHSVSDIWIDGVHHELADDGDTLIESPETDKQRAERIRLIESLN